ncbi:MAG: N-6 DNA methylase, partial [Terriglobia bacterium]
DFVFLKEIEAWRDELARNIAVRNPRLSQRELNFAVQRTIDRIIFLRICEDRAIETYCQLQVLCNGTQVYKRVCELFQRADERYNSGLFHFEKEKERLEPPDDLTLGLSIDDKPLKEIIKNLYYPDSPYEFSVLPADILGQVYEQFLGKVIRLTPAHHAVVEDKPEVKKAGGVYYTPTYIVDYIVKNTVGKLVGQTSSSASTSPKENPGEDRVPALQIKKSTRQTLTPKQVTNLRILDPACGSGSFLIGAYQYLLDWHRDWYVNDGPAKHTKEIYEGPGGSWRLTTAERKRILLSNIYGVDIDPQAVEVTKLSLLLKVLEGESDQTLTTQFRLFHERALPDLGRNIKCGNSLIGPDFCVGQQMSLLDDEERYRINAFDWKAEFPDIIKGGGFDAVIGNPPYIRIQTMKEWAPLEVEIYKDRYKSAGSGNYDIYVVFVEKALSLLNARGRFGFILPHKFFNAQYGEALRSLISRGKHLAHVVHFGDQQVFNGASTYTCLMFLNKAGSDECRVVKAHNLGTWRTEGKATVGTIHAASIGVAEWNFAVGKSAELLEKLSKIPVKLQDVTSRIFQGIKTSADKIYIVEELQRKGKRVKVYSRQKEAEYWLEADLLHPLIKGGDSKRYRLSRTNRLILFPYAKHGDIADLIPEETFKEEYPKTWAYLLDNKSYLEDREDGKMEGKHWYAFGRSQALDVMPLPKIFTPDIAAQSSFSLDETGEVFFTGGVSGGYGILVLPEYSPKFILGLLNSRLLEWFIQQTATQMRGGYYSYESRFIRSLPIERIIPGSGVVDSHRERVVSLVERIIDLKTRFASVHTEHDKTSIGREIDTMDHLIDQVVYQIYGLTDDEIKAVESAKNDH